MTHVSLTFKPALDRLYDSFNAPDSAVDPIQIVRRYPRVDDREIVAFIAAGLAFGRVASVMTSVEAVCRVLGPSPAEFLREFDPARDGAPLLPLVHRWTKGRDFVALLWILKGLIAEHGSIERAFASGLTSQATDVGEALESLAARARSVPLGPAYGRVPRQPGVFYFFARPSTGAACKRLNLFLRWMVRTDAVDPGGWTLVAPRQLVVPLDTHTIRTGRCLRLTRRSTPGWLMASDITASLRALDPDDPVRYDFALCHLSMMGACGFGSRQGDQQCPLRGCCKPRIRPKAIGQRPKS
ncbi:MAG TPA: TIGR02757 family protein [Vicinamibacterales bacterium]|nr:TIGR02757 family protein [Vicinamibacterales bacterium]